MLAVLVPVKAYERVRTEREYIMTVWPELPLAPQPQNGRWHPLHARRQDHITLAARVQVTTVEDVTLRRVWAQNLIGLEHLLAGRVEAI